MGNNLKFFLFAKIYFFYTIISLFVNKMGEKALMKKVFIICITLFLTACSSTESIIPPVTCDIIVPTNAVKKYREFIKTNPSEARRLYANQCELDEGKRCSEKYIDRVEEFAYSVLYESELQNVRYIQTNHCTKK